MHALNTVLNCEILTERKRGSWNSWWDLLVSKKAPLFSSKGLNKGDSCDVKSYGIQTVASGLARLILKTDETSLTIHQLVESVWLQRHRFLQAEPWLIFTPRKAVNLHLSRWESQSVWSTLAIISLVAKCIGKRVGVRIFLFENVAVWAVSYWGDTAANDFNWEGLGCRRIASV